MPTPSRARLSPRRSPHALAIAAVLAACTPRSRPAEDAPTPTPTPTPEAAEATTTAAAPIVTAEPTPPPLTRHDPRPRTVAVAGSHVCALAGKGQVACWGGGLDGQLGPGIAEHRASPSIVAGLEDAVAVLASRTASCALRADRSVSCWGKIDGGAPGLRTTRALGEIVELAISDYSDPRLCARRSDGSVACLILAELSSGAVLVIPGVSDAVGLEIDGRELYILRASGELVSTTLDKKEIAAPAVTLPEPVVDLARVDYRLCLLLQSGEMRCRAYASTWRSEVPTAGPLWKSRLPGEHWARAVDYDASIATRCLRDDAGAVACWGDNTYGQLGLGKPAFSARPRRIFPGAASAVFAGADASCGIFGDGDLKCFEHALYDEEIEVEGVRRLAISTGHLCAIVGGGEARCWGFSDTGALGRPGDPEGLVRVPGLSDLVLIATGEDHSCAARRDHSVRCWGLAAGGQLGDGRYEDESDHGDEDEDGEHEPPMSATPVVVADLPGDLTSLAAAADYTCVGGQSGLHCWGTIPEPEEIEDAVIPRPRQFLATPILAVDAADDSLCVLEQGGVLHCWGAVAQRYHDGDFIHLDHGDDGDDDGDGDDEDDHDDYPELEEGNAEPFRRGGPLWRLGGLSFAPQAVAVGSEHACLLAAAGDVHCWGDNDEGQLGDGTTTDRPRPVKVQGLPGPALQIDAGSHHSCARVEGGGIYCWGSKTAAKEYGRLAEPRKVEGLEAFTRVGGGTSATPTPTPSPSITPTPGVTPTPTPSKP